MVSLSDDQIRRLILELLRKRAKERPNNPEVGRSEMISLLQIPENVLDYNILHYLEEYGFVRLLSSRDGWHCAEITALGIDVIDHKEEFKSQFPFITATINIHGDNYGNIAQAVGESVINFNQQVSDAFKKAYEMIEGKTDIASEQKEETKKNAKMLEEELKKEKCDAGKIQQFWDWLRQNASWIVPTLTPVVMEGIKMAFGGSA